MFIYFICAQSGVFTLAQKPKSLNISGDLLILQTDESD
jgi:hypothetical protein